MPSWIAKLLASLALLVERLAPYLAGYGMGSVHQTIKHYRKLTDEAKLARQIENDVASRDADDVRRMLDKFKR